MKNLTEKQKKVKQLRIVEGKTLYECARILGVSYARVWQTEKEIFKKEMKNETH